LSFLFSNQIFAQTSSLISPSNKTAADYPEKQELFNNLAFNSNVESIHFMEFCEWESCLNEGQYFSITFQGYDEIWMPSYVEEFDNRVHYGGPFDGQTGDLSIVDYGSRIAGSIGIGGEIFSIVPLEGREVLLVNYNDSGEQHSCGVINNVPTSAPVVCDEAFDFCSGTVKVLFLATQNAINYITDQGFTLEEYVDRNTIFINQTLINSALVNKRITSVFHPNPFGHPDPGAESTLFDLNDPGSKADQLRI